MKMRKSAFTLAEVIMVLGIIGVVSAVAIPNLTKSVDKEKYVASLKGVTTDISIAYKSAKEKYNGEISDWMANDSTTTNKSKRAATRIMDYLNVEKDCGTSTGCFRNEKVQRYTVSGTTLSTKDDFSSKTIDADTDKYKFILNGGTAIAFDCNTSYLSSDNTSNYCYVIMDLDGKDKGFNTLGIDIFVMKLENSGLADTTAEKPLTRLKTCFNAEQKNMKPEYCTDWVLTTGNMDYLDCYENLSDSQKTCN